MREKFCSFRSFLSRTPVACRTQTRLALRTRLTDDRQRHHQPQGPALSNANSRLIAPRTLELASTGQERAETPLTSVLMLLEASRTLSVLSVPVDGAIEAAPTDALQAQQAQEQALNIGLTAPAQAAI